MDDPLRKFHLRTGVLDALSRYGIAHDNPMRAELEANATIVAGDSSRVIMKNGNSLDWRFKTGSVRRAWTRVSRRLRAR
jgi:hypothetical protein